MKEIEIFPLVGDFAEDKDVARDLRLRQIIPALEKGEDVILDFKGVNAVTQSFVHALISDLFRKFGNDVLDHISFRTCNETVQKILTIVIDYMQEAE